MTGIVEIEGRRYALTVSLEPLEAGNGRAS
jgi:hypothetical protein